MQVIINGKVGDSSAALVSGRIQFTQAQRMDNGELLITSTKSEAQVVRGELQTRSGQPFELPSNPEGTAVRVLEMLGGETFEWWTAVPEGDSIEYRALPIMESDDVPASIWGPPPWVAEVNASRDQVVETIAEAQVMVDTLGGLTGITTLVTQANNSATAASDSAAFASTEADRATEAADSIDMSALNTRMNDMDTAIADKRDQVTGNSRLYATGEDGSQTSVPYGVAPVAGSVPVRGSGGRLVGLGDPTAATDAANRQWVEAAVLAKVKTNPYLGQATLWSYGHSFTSVPNNYCTANGGEYPLRLKEMLGFNQVVPNGRGATYLPDTMALALNGVRATDKSRTWPGLTTIASSDNAHGVANGPDYRDMPRGVVLIQNYLNETAYPWALTPEYLEFWKRCLRTLIATTGSKGQKSSTGAIGTTAAGGVHAWSDMVATTLYSNLFPDKLLFRSSQAGDYREFRVDGDDIWILTAAGKPSSSSRQLDIYVNGFKIQSLTPAGMMAQDYVPVIAESEAANLWPVALKVSGLNAAAGTTGFKTVRVQVAPTAGWAYLSGALFPRKSPPPVFVAYEPPRFGVADWATKSGLYRTAIDQVVSEFPQATAVDLDKSWDFSTMNITGDIHPNDRGQAYLASLFADKINSTITGWNPGAATL